jgi:hypothetical protein
MQNIHLDYYELGITPVVIVRNQKGGTGLQAWRSDIESNRMVRDDMIILDIDENGTSDFRPISKENFERSCAELRVITPHISFFFSPAANAVENMSPSFRRDILSENIANDEEIAPFRAHLQLVA